MKKFKNSLATFMNRTNKFFENFNDIVDSFDIDSHVDFLNEKGKEFFKRGNDLLSDFNEVINQVKENISDFKVEVPFNEGEKINYEIEDGKLTVETSYEDENTVKSYKTTVTIPNNCDIGKAHISFDKNHNVANVIIPKVTKKKIKKNKCNKPLQRDSKGRFVRKTMTN